MRKNKKFILISIIVLFLFFLCLNFSLKKPYDFFVAKKMLKEGKYLKALQIYSTYKDSMNKNPKYFFITGTIYILLTEYGQSIKCMQKSLQLDSEGRLKKDIYYNLGVIYYKKDLLDKALKYFKKSAIIDSQDIECKKNIEMIMRKMGKTFKENKKVLKTIINKQKTQKKNQILNYVNEIEKSNIKKIFDFHKSKEDKKKEKDW